MVLFMENGLIAADETKVLTVEEYGFRCKNNFTAFLGYNDCFLYHY